MSLEQLAYYSCRDKSLGSLGEYLAATEAQVLAAIGG
jgi:hypothetical protein